MSQTFNKKSPTIKRILREASELASAPSPDYHAAPLESNLFEWHFTLRGPPSTPYAGGIYHGRISLPPQYPLRPPSFRFLTPSGRFEVNREICLSISGHHEDTWQPAWGVRTAVVALRGFMEGEAGGQLGGMECSAEVREKIAGESSKWKCEGCGQSNEEILAESAAKAKELEDAGEGSTVRSDEVLPEGLKLGYKDEMKQEEGQTGAGEGSSSGTPIPTPTTIGSTSTTPGTPGTPVVQQNQYQFPQLPVPSQHQPHPPQVPQVPPPHLQGQLPAYLNPLYAPRPAAVPAQQQRRVETPWLDKFIWALIVALAALVARRYWGLDLVRL